VEASLEGDEPCAAGVLARRLEGALDRFGPARREVRDLERVRQEAGEPCGEIESTKSVSDLYSPVDGEVTDVNADIEDDPGQVNSDPYGVGWLFKVRLDDEPPSDLLTAEQYAELISAEG